MTEIRCALELRDDETRKGPGRLTGTLLTYGERAADRPELFEVGSLSWPDSGIPINRQHVRTEAVARVIPMVRGNAVMIDAPLPDTQRGRDLAVEIRAGLFTGLSVEFKATRQRFVGRRAADSSGRTLGAAGVVDSPAYAGKRCRGSQRWTAGVGGGDDRTWYQPTGTGRGARELSPKATADLIVAGLLATAGGGADPISSASGAVTAAAGVWARCLAAADVDHPAVSRECLGSIGFDLAMVGEHVSAVQVDAGGVRLVRASSWDVQGYADPASWRYRLNLAGPSFLTTMHLEPAAVLHIRYLPDSQRPWCGVARGSGRPNWPRWRLRSKRR